MAYNKGLTQADKDRINQGVRDRLTQGMSKEEAMAWRDSEVNAAKANVPADQTDAPGGQAQPNTDLASGSGSSGSQEYETQDQFSQRAGKKKDRYDADGEVINLARDFGDVGEFVESIPFIGDVVDDIYGAVKGGWAQGQTVDDALALFAGGADTDPETIQKFIEAVENQRNQPVSKEMQDFNNIYEESGGGAWGFIKAIAQNPTVAATTAVSSMIAMMNPASAAGAGIGAAGGAAIAAAPTLGIGAGVGAVGGAFAGAGGVLETGSSFTEFLQEELTKKGLDFDEEGIAKVLSDEDALASIRGRSAARGGVIAVIDGLTAGIAGKVAGGVSKTAKIAPKLKSVLAATAIEGAGGGVGEASARLAVGQELDAREIGLEIVGEFGTGIAIGKTVLATQPAYEIAGQRVNIKTVEATIKADPEVAADIVVKNDPELQNIVNESISKNDKINENQDILTDDEKSDRSGRVESIKDNIRERNQHDKKSPEFAAIDQIIQEERAELKEVTKEQNRKYKNVHPTQRTQLIASQQQISQNNEAIKSLQQMQENNETTTRSKIIERLQSQNEELVQEQAQVRGEITQEYDIRVAKAEQAAAKKQEAAEALAAEEVAPEEQVEAEAQAEQQAAIQEQMNAEIDEEASDNGQKIDKLADDLLELGIDLKPVQSSVPTNKGVDYIPLSKEGDAFAGGDFERTIEFDPDIPLEKVDAKKTVKQIKDQAKQLGATAEVDIVQSGEGWGITGKITAGKRPESLAVKYAKENEAAQEGAPIEAGVEPGVEDAATLPEQEEVQKTRPAKRVSKGKKASGRDVGKVKAADAPALQNYIEGRPDVELAEEGTLQANDTAGAYRSAAAARKLGYPNAIVDADTNQVSLGPIDPNFDKQGAEFSIEEGDDFGIERDEQGNIVRQGQIDNYIQDIKDNPGFDADYYRQNYADDSLTAEEAEFAEDQALEGTPQPEFSADEAPTNFTEHQNLRDVAGKKVQLNIGLENNPVDNINGIIRKLESDSRVRLGTTEQVTGEYEGNPERTVVVDAKFDGTAKDFRSYIEKLNADLTQEAIGVKYDGRGALIYDPKFKGDKYTFDPQYFLNPSNKKSDRAGANTAEDVAKRLGIDPSALHEKLAPGETYTVEKQHKISTTQVTGEALKKVSVGGKGGFAAGTAGDVREQKKSISSEGRLFTGSKPAQDIADFNESLEKVFKGIRFENKEGLPKPLTAIYEYQETRDEKYDDFAYQNDLSPADGIRSVQDLHAQGHISDDVLNAANDRYDNLVGYDGAHQNLNNDVIIQKVPELNLPTRSKKGAPKTPIQGNRADEIYFKGGQRTHDQAIRTDANPGDNIVLSKDVKEREGTQEFEPSFDRSEVKGPSARTLREDLGDQPKVDESFVKDYNDGKIDDNQLIKSISPYITYIQKDKGLQGVALAKFSEQVKAGKLKGKSVKQIFGAARTIASGAKTLENVEYGQSRDYQRDRNVVRRAEQAFQAQEGYAPDNDQLANFINTRTERGKKVYKIDDMTPERIEDARFDEFPEVELGGTQGEARDRAQTRIAKEAGLDLLTDDILDPSNLDAIDSAVSDLLSQRQVTPSKGKFTEQAPRRGASFDVKGDKTAARIKKANTEIDKDVAQVIGRFVGRQELIDAYPRLKELFKLKPNSFEEMAPSERKDLKRKVVKGLASEAEERLGKTPGLETPSPEFSLTESEIYSQTAPSRYMEVLSRELGRAWPGEEVVFDQKSWSEGLADVQEKEGTVPANLKGMVWRNKVYLNPSSVTYDTPIHEYAHIWAKRLRSGNPALWRRGVTLLTGVEFNKLPNGRFVVPQRDPRKIPEKNRTKYLNAVLKNRIYTKYLDNGDYTRFYEEVMANAIGKHGAKKYLGSKFENWMKQFSKWIKDKLNISSKNDYADLTLGDWLDIGTHGVFTGQVTKPTEKAEFSAAEEPTFDSDVAAARLAGKKAEGKWYKKPLKWLIPPASEDYHGLIRDLKLKGLDALTGAFVDNHHAYVNKATKIRSAVARASKGINLSQKNVVTYKGNQLSAAQAIQAHVNGFPNKFSQKPKIQKYIDTMTKLGVLKENDGYDVASPQADLVNYIVNDLYTESFKDFNSKKEEVFTPEVMERLLAEKGEKYVTALKSALGRMSTGKNPGYSSKITQKWNDWALGSVGVTMFLNFRSAALQMLSVGNYGFHSKNPGAFFAAFTNPETFAEAKKLFNDPYLKERRARAGFDVNANEMMTLLQNSNSFSDFTKKVLNKGFVATSAVDSMAIALGGAAFIKAQVKAGVSPTEAKRQWKEQTEKAQQSSRPDRVSQWQTEGVSKYVLAFANTPQQYFRLSRKALREIRAGRNVKSNIARIGYYMAVQNAIFTSLQAASMALMNGLGDEGEEEEELGMINSMLDTVLRGMGIYGAVASTMKNIAFEGWKQEEKPRPDHVATALKAVSISPPLNRKVQDLLSIGRGYNFDSDDKHVNALARGTAFATNLPADWIHKKAKAVANLQDEQYGNFEKLLMLLGWSEYNFKKDDSIDFDFGDDFEDDFDFDDDFDF